MIISTRDTKALFFPAALRCHVCDGRGKTAMETPKEDYIWLPCTYCAGQGIPPIPPCELEGVR